MDAQLLAHDNHASGLGGEHSPVNYMTHPVWFFNEYPITLHIPVPPGTNNVVFLLRTVCVLILFLSLLSFFLVCSGHFAHFAQLVNCFCLVHSVDDRYQWWWRRMA